MMPAHGAVMSALSLFLSSSGRIGARPFWLAALAIYAAACGSQALLAPPVTATAGLWPFAAAQALLVWAWYAVHAKRLRDAGLGAGVATGIAALCALAALLLLLIATLVLDTGGAAPGEPSGSQPLAFVLLFHLFALLSGAVDLGLFGLIMAALLALAMLPVLVALGFSVWTGTRPVASS